VETVNQGEEDGRIDEVLEYNKSNQLIRWVEYNYFPFPVGSIEEKIQYNNRGLQIKTTNYRNGQFVNEFSYKYHYW